MDSLIFTMVLELGKVAQSEYLNGEMKHKTFNSILFRG